VEYAARRFRQLAEQPRNPLAWFTAAIRANWHAGDTAEQRQADADRAARVQASQRRRTEDRDRARRAQADAVTRRLGAMSHAERQAFARAAVLAFAQDQGIPAADLFREIQHQGHGSALLRAAIVARIDQEKTR
jgi:hypothetical protein